MKYHAISVYFHVYVTCVQLLNSFSDQIRHVIAKVTLYTSDVIIFIVHDEARFLKKRVWTLKEEEMCTRYVCLPIFRSHGSTSEVSWAHFYAYLLKEVEPVIPGRVPVADGLHSAK